MVIEEHSKRENITSGEQKYMKKIFFYTDVLPLLSKEKIAIDKLKDNLKLFMEASDKILLVWHPWSKTEEYLEINRSAVTEEYLNILKEYKKASWGELDESDTMEKAKKKLLSCDAYYGDVSELAFYAQDAKIPVMIRNIEIL